MDAVERFARRHGIAVVEDAAQAHGATWKGRVAGGFGTAAAFSFYPSKNLGAIGDGGHDLHPRPRDRRGRPLVPQHRPAVEGRARRRRIQRAPRHDPGGGPAGEAPAPGPVERDAPRGRAHLPGVPPGDGRNPARARRTPTTSITCSRCGSAPEIGSQAALERLGMGTGIHYSPPLHRQPPFADARREFPVASRWAAEELSLPMFPELTERQVLRVCDVVAEGATRGRRSSDAAAGRAQAQGRPGRAGRGSRPRPRGPGWSPSTSGRRCSAPAPSARRSTRRARTCSRRRARGPTRRSRCSRRRGTIGIRETAAFVRQRLDELGPLGYSAAGEVIEVGSGVRGIAPGDRVAIGGGGMANHAEVDVVSSLLCARDPGGRLRRAGGLRDPGRDRDQRLPARRGRGRLAGWRSSGSA